MIELHIDLDEVQLMVEDEDDDLVEYLLEVELLQIMIAQEL